MIQQPTLCTLCRQEEVEPGQHYCWVCDDRGDFNAMVDEWAEHNVAQYLVMTGDEVTVTHEDSRGRVSYHRYVRTGSRIVRV